MSHYRPHCSVSCYYRALLSNGNHSEDGSRHEGQRSEQDISRGMRTKLSGDHRALAGALQFSSEKPVEHIKYFWFPDLRYEVTVCDLQNKSDNSWDLMWKKIKFVKLSPGLPILGLHMIIYVLSKLHVFAKHFHFQESKMVMLIQKKELN